MEVYFFGMFSNCIDMLKKYATIEEMLGTFS